MFSSAVAKVVAIAAANPIALRRLAIVIPSTGVGAAAVLADEPRQLAFNIAAVPVRLGASAWTAAATLADYKYSLSGLDGSKLEAVRSGCHQRGADRLVALCFRNGGVYIKLGQHIGMLDHLLPAEYVLTMRRHLLDACPVCPWSSVRRTIMEDLGAAPETLFRSIETEPIASASLAQVHVAIDHDGRKRAVKVQHRGLRETSAVDLKTIELLVRTIKWVAPSIDYLWLVEEANENLVRKN
jgi:aarF domain-containing kinase